MPIKKPILMIIAIIISLLMVRLGVWQMDRAEQKQQILSQSLALAELPPVSLMNLLDQVDLDSSALRFRQITATGQYLADKTILIDNQVFESQVGYALLTPFRLKNSGAEIIVDRGWLPVGASRDQLPVFETPREELTLIGRLNLPYAKPPLWNDEFAVAQGQVWQYLPVDEFRQQTKLDVLPLMLELAPQDATQNAVLSPKINWQTIDDKWVAKHQAYALQWFCMAIVFLLACSIVLAKSIRNPKAEKE